jgi:hypothetical protein
VEKEAILSELKMLPLHFSSGTDEKSSNLQSGFLLQNGDFNPRPQVYEAEVGLIGTQLRRSFLRSFVCNVE